MRLSSEYSASETHCIYVITINSVREHPGLNRGQSDLQSDALPLSYAPLLYNRKDEKEKT